MTGAPVSLGLGWLPRQFIHVKTTERGVSGGLVGTGAEPGRARTAQTPRPDPKPLPASHSPDLSHPQPRPLDLPISRETDSAAASSPAACFSRHSWDGATSAARLTPTLSSLCKPCSAQPTRASCGPAPTPAFRTQRHCPILTLGSQHHTPLFGTVTLPLLGRNKAATSGTHKRSLGHQRVDSKAIITPCRLKVAFRRARNLFLAAGKQMRDIFFN